MAMLASSLQDYRIGIRSAADGRLFHVGTRAVSKLVSVYVSM